MFSQGLSVTSVSISATAHQKKCLKHRMLADFPKIVFSEEEVKQKLELLLGGLSPLAAQQPFTVFSSLEKHAASLLTPIITDDYQKALLLLFLRPPTVSALADIAVNNIQFKRGKEWQSLATVSRDNYVGKDFASIFGMTKERWKSRVPDHIISLLLLLDNQSVLRLLLSALYMEQGASDLYYQDEKAANQATCFVSEVPGNTVQFQYVVPVDTYFNGREKNKLSKRCFFQLSLRINKETCQMSSFELTDSFSCLMPYEQKIVLAMFADAKSRNMMRGQEIIAPPAYLHAKEVQELGISTGTEPWGVARKLFAIPETVLIKKAAELACDLINRELVEASSFPAVHINGRIASTRKAEARDSSYDQLRLHGLHLNATTQRVIEQLLQEHCIQNYALGLLASGMEGKEGFKVQCLNTYLEPDDETASPIATQPKEKGTQAKIGIEIVVDQSCVYYFSVNVYLNGESISFLNPAWSCPKGLEKTLTVAENFPPIKISKAIVKELAVPPLLHQSPKASVSASI